ncbi:unnamed protein product, partial [Brassica rapa subsp. narinosa]
FSWICTNIIECSVDVIYLSFSLLNGLKQFTSTLAQLCFSDFQDHREKTFTNFFYH